ncbi:hypothetical protein [Enterococcus sp. HY326]|uniref:hypothetical protein n=1 Tax=Enterococcus sp. HY326 TaxID=2971265 RepID=UPI00223FC74E|nr:hypothetical protein [Enterococcus sp. HY326]
MLTSIKNFLKNFTTTTPFILSNTLIIVPYLLFLQLSDGTTWQSVLPFVLFYTFRFTGLFLIRGLSTQLESFTLLMAAFLLGGLGSVSGFLGMLFPGAYPLAAILLGLSASWLTPANITVNYQEAQQGFHNMTAKKYPFALLGLLGLFWLINQDFPASVTVSLVLALYGLFFVAAYHTLRHYPHFEINFASTSKNFIAYRELVMFAIFFLLLLLLRSGRLLFDSGEIDIALIGFILVFTIAIWLLSRKKASLQLPFWLNWLNFVNGMIGNFLFLFISLYVSGTKGIEAVASQVYLPYVLGMVAAMVLGPLYLQHLTKVAPVSKLVFGLCLSLLLIIWPATFLLGFALLCFFKSTTSSWLNQQYYQKISFPAGSGVLAKFSLQNKGSLTAQFFIMGLLAILVFGFHGDNRLFLRILSSQGVSSSGQQILNDCLLVLVGLLLICLAAAWFLWCKNPLPKTKT